MIIQKVVKGICLKSIQMEHPDPTETDEVILQQYAEDLFETGIICRWWQKVKLLPSAEIPNRLTDSNLDWHQNRYNDPDPLRNYQPFSEETPFISTTAGTVVRDNFGKTNILESAQMTALRFATDWWHESGLLAFCYLFTLGKQAVGHRQFSEEMRELNIYTGFSPYQPEGEITAKIDIPTTQIERVEIWLKSDYQLSIRRGYLNPLSPSRTINNTKYLPPEAYHNIRELL